MNVLKPDKKAALITLLKNKISQREISRKARIDRKTIRKYGRQLNILPRPDKDHLSPSTAAGLDENPPPRPPVFLLEKIPFHARFACEPHQKWIAQQVRLGRNAMAIYQDLVEQFNFNHKYNSVKRFVRGLKHKAPEQFDRLEFLPGEEAQVDYGQGAMTLHLSGKYRRPRLFVMTFKYSRRSFRKVVWKSSQETWRAWGHTLTWRAWGHTLICDYTANRLRRKLLLLIKITDQGVTPRLP